MLMLAASSGKVKITKPGAKEQSVFLGVQWSNKRGKRYHTLACERNEFLRHPPHCGIGYHRTNFFHPNSYPELHQTKLSPDCAFFIQHSCCLEKQEETCLCSKTQSHSTTASISWPADFSFHAATAQGFYLIMPGLGRGGECKVALI